MNPFEEIHYYVSVRASGGRHKSFHIDNNLLLDGSQDDQILENNSLIESLNHLLHEND